MRFWPPNDQVIRAPIASRLQVVPCSVRPSQWWPVARVFFSSSGAAPLFDDQHVEPAVVVEVADGEAARGEALREHRACRLR